jgi:hypothetical protein
VLGVSLGDALGLFLGVSLGDSLGLPLGASLGEALGLLLGVSLGVALEDALGLLMSVVLGTHHLWEVRYLAVKFGLPKSMHHDKSIACPMRHRQLYSHPGQCPLDPHSTRECDTSNHLQD